LDTIRVIRAVKRITAADVNRDNHITSHGHSHDPQGCGGCNRFTVCIQLHTATSLLRNPQQHWNHHQNRHDELNERKTRNRYKRCHPRHNKVYIHRRHIPRSVRGRGAVPKKSKKGKNGIEERINGLIKVRRERSGFQGSGQEFRLPVLAGE